LDLALIRDEGRDERFCFFVAELLLPDPSEPEPVFLFSFALTSSRSWVKRGVGTFDNGISSASLPLVGVARVVAWQGVGSAARLAEGAVVRFLNGFVLGRGVKVVNAGDDVDVALRSPKVCRISVRLANRLPICCLAAAAFLPDKST
jgi:hypothetical protein